MRERFKNLFDNVVIGILYGVSGIGTKICIYEWTKETGLSPAPIPEDPIRLKDTAPVNRWNHDIMTPEGEQRFREVVAHIKTMCAQLRRFVH